MKHKLGLIGFSYLAGLICAAFFKSQSVFILSLILLSLFVLFQILKKKTAAVALFTAFAATVVCGVYTCIFYIPLIAKDGETVYIDGIIAEYTEYPGDRASYIIKTKIDGIDATITLFSSDISCKTGDGISFTGKLSSAKNNTSFSEESYYRSKGIFMKAAAVSELVTTPSAFTAENAIIDFSNHIGYKIKNMLPGDEGSFLKAVFLGDKSDLPHDLSNNIKRAGISHFTAISGLHLTVAAHILMLLISLTPLKNHRYIKFLVLSFIILLFTVFFRLSVSVLRSGIMLIIYYGAEPFMRKGSTFNSMGAAILAITLFQPYACHDPALLMSLSGTFGIGVISPLFCKGLKKNSLYGIKTFLAGTFFATVSTFPFVCIFFNGFSAAGIMVNLLMYPLFIPVLVLMVLFVLSLGYGTFFLYPAGILARIMTDIINLTGSFRYSYFNISYDIMIPVLIISMIFIGLIYIVFRSRRETAAAFILSLCIIIGSSVVLNTADRDKTKLLMYSDGNDACVIVNSPEGVFVAASSDSPDIAEYIKDFMKTEFTDKITAIAVLRENRNNLQEFKNIPSEILMAPSLTDPQTYESRGMILLYKENRATIKTDDTSITISPAGDPVNDDINILYGYKKNLPELSGIVFCSSSRVNANDKGYTNIYFDTAEYLITKNGSLEPKKIFYM